MLPSSILFPFLRRPSHAARRIVSSLSALVDHSDSFIVKDLCGSAAHTLKWLHMCLMTSFVITWLTFIQINAPARQLHAGYCYISAQLVWVLAQFFLYSYFILPYSDLRPKKVTAWCHRRFFKGPVHSQICHHFIPNLHDLFSSSKHKIKYFEEWWKPNRSNKCYLTLLREKTYWDIFFYFPQR